MTNGKLYMEAFRLLCFSLFYADNCYSLMLWYAISCSEASADGDQQWYIFLKVIIFCIVEGVGQS